MSVNSGKLLCIGGDEHGKWIEKKEFHEVYPHEGYFLRPHTYEPRNLLNPLSQKEELYYVIKSLGDDRAVELLKRVLTNN
ncbi:hypothetical protein [Acinetobacter pittii]|uniref:hypothetical protein n=1 Tax=Acinetobacter pittii TaxID=48296 RepID=UPI003260B0BF